MHARGSLMTTKGRGPPNRRAAHHRGLASGHVWAAMHAAILAACDACDAEQVRRELHQNYADLDRRDERGRTLLHAVCERSNAVMVQAVLQHGADPNLCDGEGVSPLHFALPDASIVLRKRGGSPDIVMATPTTSERSTSNSHRVAASCGGR